MSDRLAMTCSAVDELAASYALGALDAGEERAVSTHLATCSEPHVEARSLIDAALVVASSLEPVPPSAALRDRLMTTIAATPQEHRPAAALGGQPQRDPRRAAPILVATQPSSVRARRSRSRRGDRTRRLGGYGQ